jgi:hypothetical protein
MTAEQRWILELADVLALRLECARCGAAIVARPMEWREVPIECPGCRNHWELPGLAENGLTPMQYLGLGLRRLAEQVEAAKKQGRERPYRVCLEIADPASSRWSA